MRTLPIAVTALAATLTLTLTACDDGGDKKETGGGKGGAPTACTADGLGQEVVASEAPAAGDTGTVSVTLTNGSGADCTLEGFPSVVLKADAGADGLSVAPQESAKPEKLTVKRDETAGFTITYVRGPAGDATKSVAVKTVTFGLPGADAEKSFPWKYGEVALRSETEPDASVTPLQRTGD